jgi:integrase
MATYFIFGAVGQCPACGPIAANRVRAALSALWSNPVSFTFRHAEKPRERTLTNAELKAVWNATDGEDDYARIVRLCLLTGCRRAEIGDLLWAEVLDDRIIIGADRTKGESAHAVPLLPMIAAALPGRPEKSEGHVFGRFGTGFSGWSKSKRSLGLMLGKAGIDMPPWGSAPTLPGSRSGRISW